jgi:hypothetical protein
VELPGVDHLPWIGDADALLDEVEEFLTGVRRGSEPDRVLATVLFTDIVGATATAAALGDHAWGDLLQAHHATVRRELARFRGRELDTAGDGFLATFDGPAHAERPGAAHGGRPPAESITAVSRHRRSSAARTEPTSAYLVGCILLTACTLLYARHLGRRMGLLLIGLYILYPGLNLPYAPDRPERRYLRGGCS